MVFQWKKLCKKNPRNIGIIFIKPVLSCKVKKIKAHFRIEIFNASAFWFENQTLPLSERWRSGNTRHTRKDLLCFTPAVSGGFPSHSSLSHHQTMQVAISDNTLARRFRFQMKPWFHLENVRTTQISDCHPTTVWLR